MQMASENANCADKFRNRPNPVACFISICFCLLFCIAAESGWIEVRSPNFVVISDASPKQARHAAKSLEQFRGVLLTSLPMLKLDSESPLVVFAARDNRSMKALFPGSGQEKGSFMSSSERSFAVLDINAPGDLAYKDIYHKYAGMVLRRNFLNLPLWLSEGLGEFLGSFNISDKASDIGRPTAKLLRILRTQPRLPLTVLLAIKPESQYYRRQEKFEAFHAQSWAFTHYLMFGDEKAHAGQLSQLLDLLQKDVPPLEAAARALGDLSILESGFDRYLSKMVFQHSSVPVQPDLKEDQYAVRMLSQADSLALRGELLLHAGRLDDARVMIERALKQDPRSAKANEGIGLLYVKLQNQEDLRKANEQTRSDSEKRKSDKKDRQMKTGPAGKAKGFIRSVKCSSPAIIDIELNSNGKQYKFHAENFYAVQYWTTGVPVNSGFAPCDVLEGKRVEIEYFSVSGQEYSGLIQSIAIEK
jgi:tetratricopeptide (TPR) repeat protein